MKKILFAVLVLLLCNCSDDTKAQQDDSLNGTLIKKIVYTDNAGNKDEYNFAYDENKLLNITQNSNNQSNTSTLLFTYTSNVITKITTLRSKAVYAIEDYDYVNGKVNSYSLDYVNDPFREKTTYTYNSDASVTFNELSTYKPTNQESKGETGKLFYRNGNTVKVEKFENVEIEYDNNLNPLKNIIGFNLLLDKLPYYFGAGGVNNCTKISEIDLLPTPSTIITEFEYLYDERGYPKSAKVKHTENKITSTSTIQYFY